jgi:hypothetical protein
LGSSVNRGIAKGDVGRRPFIEASAKNFSSAESFAGLAINSRIPPDFSAPNLDDAGGETPFND